MSILIRGMKMPTSCFDCPLSHPAQGILTLCCGLSGKLTTAPDCEKNRLEDCPLVPVPPHGRLICDREVKWAFDDAIMTEAQQTGKVRATSDEIAKIISSVPTIIPTEEGS